MNPDILQNEAEISNSKAQRIIQDIKDAQAEVARLKADIEKWRRESDIRLQAYIDDLERYPDQEASYQSQIDAEKSQMEKLERDTLMKIDAIEKNISQSDREARKLQDDADKKRKQSRLVKATALWPVDDRG